MAIEWEETVETKRMVRLTVTHGPSCHDATVDDLRSACEAAGLVVETRERAAADLADRTNLREAYQRLADERDACLDALSEHVSPDATADTPRMVRPSSLLAGIRSLQGRLRDARSDLREHDAALEAAVERRSEEADASTEQARAILNAVPGEDIVSAARRTMASLARSVEKGEALAEKEVARKDKRIQELEVRVRALRTELTEVCGETRAKLAERRAIWRERCEDAERKCEMLLSGLHEIVGSDPAGGSFPAIRRMKAEHDRMKAQLKELDGATAHAKSLEAAILEAVDAMPESQARDPMQLLRKMKADLAAARARAEKAESRISKAEATSGVSLESVASAYAFACKKLGINPDSDNLGRGVVHATRERDDLRARLETAEAELRAIEERGGALREAAASVRGDAERIRSLEADLAAVRAEVASLAASSVALTESRDAAVAERDEARMALAETAVRCDDLEAVVAQRDDLRARLERAERLHALRAALTEARTVLSLCKTARNRSVPEYLGVRDIGRNIGYGAMMSAASSAWAEMFDGTPQEGAQHTCGPSEVTVRSAIARIDEVLSPGAHVGAAKKGSG